MGKNPNRPGRIERRKRSREQLKHKKTSINIRKIIFGIGAAALLVAFGWAITRPNPAETQKKTADLIASVRQCIGKTINDDTGLGLWERDQVMTTAGIIVDEIRYIVRSSEVTPSIIQLESTPRNMRRRNEGKIYRDEGLDGDLDGVLQGGTLASAVPIQTNSADSDEFFEGLQAVAKACDSEELDMGDLEGTKAESLSPQQLYEELKESPFFYPTKFIEAKSPTAKTVILLGDNHAQPSSTFRQLQILSNLGIRDVEIEGWCGKETDEKRGARILNANIDLINKLLQSGKFNVVGVEDPKYQDILKLYALLEAFDINVHYAEDEVDRAEQENREKQIQRIKNDLKKMGYSEEDLTRENILQKLQKHADEASLTLEEYHAKVMMELREKFSVDKLKKDTKKNEASYRIMIYGLAHIPNLSQALYEAGFNVIVLEDPYDLEHLQCVNQ